MDKGLVHIYRGTGKGKTTAAVGLSIRAIGWKKTVLFAQFLKGTISGEVDVLKSLNAVVLKDTSNNKFYYLMNETEKVNYKNSQRALFLEAKEKILSGFYSFVVLDEVLDLLSIKLITSDEIIQCINERPDFTELILTGRSAPEVVIDLADYITEFNLIKHPFDKGISARKGIEY